MCATADAGADIRPVGTAAATADGAGASQRIRRLRLLPSPGYPVVAATPCRGHAQCRCKLQVTVLLHRVPKVVSIVLNQLPAHSSTRKLKICGIAAAVQLSASCAHDAALHDSKQRLDTVQQPVPL